MKTREILDWWPISLFNWTCFIIGMGAVIYLEPNKWVAFWAFVASLHLTVGLKGGNYV